MPQALGSIGSAAKQAIPDLLPLLNHLNSYLEADVAVAIIRIEPGNNQALTVLKNLLNDEDVEIRRDTIWTLKDSGKEAKPAQKIIKTSLLDKDEAVRIAASQLLHLLEGP